MSSNVAVQPARRVLMRETAGPPRWRRGELVAWMALAGFLLVALPLFLCLSLWVDADYYGVWAWEVLHGRVLEKELNAFCKPPAMAWVLTAPLALVGWRPPYIRLFDFGLITGIVWLLAQWLRPLGLSRAARVWTALALFAFYLSTGEWCHAQPDVWMLLPALGALYLRRQQTIDALAGKDGLAEAVALAAAEGFLWGLGCLFKPFIVIPGSLTWLLSTLLVCLKRSRSGGRLALTTLGLVAGGLFAGGIWMAWLWLGGGWTSFWADFAVWSGGYYHHGPSLGRRTIFLFTQFFPWGLVNIVALPVAVGAIWRALAARRLAKRHRAPARLIQDLLLAGMYLGWVIVGDYVQFQFDYHIVPPMLLALTLVAGHCPLLVRSVRLARGRWVLLRVPGGRVALRALAGWALLLALVGLVASQHALLRPGRLRVWERCWREGSIGEVQDDLAHRLNQGIPFQFGNLRYDLGGYWDPGHVKAEDLERVAAFLRREHVRDGEVVCFGMHTTHLLLALDIAPSSRLLIPRNVFTLYPEKADLLIREMNQSIGRQRFAVSDVSEVYNGDLRLYLSRPDLRALPEDFPPDIADTFPWYEPVAFRSGPYLVHRICGPVKALHE